MWGCVCVCGGGGGSSIKTSEHSGLDKRIIYKACLILTYRLGSTQEWIQVTKISMIWFSIKASC